ncbi:hypothetical protein DMB66_05170 [Actinoplanes sp. ATCC 53533]|uniref:NACHT domain-containing protein n=1 Tax=Actinoplanes sp. ATCC 53533 TaxID=1288362 RepID=UPI000F77F793|nr:hypothetical protein [Actinoplanes sp. ATCC 53533]RSM72537.1 hypothetical protein DMB66_05170 [Actinoplanes sp. ATCC 53533]
MGSDPYTLDGARRILADTPKVVERLDRLLGLAILGSGVGFLMTGVSQLVAVFGWVDQKNELMRLLDGLVSAGWERLRTGERRNRFEVLAATHTALVYGSFFAAIRELLGPVYDELDLTDEDVAHLTTAAGERAIGLVASGRIPLPDATAGLHRTITERIEPFYRDLARTSLEFFASFAGWPREQETRDTDPLVKQITERATNRYRAEYARLAADVREFEIWAMLGEHAATQQQTDASLARLEDLVATIVRHEERGPARLLGTVRAINRDVFGTLLIPVAETGDLAGVTLPTVEAGYVSPRFRWALAGPDVRAADEQWWADQPLGDDIETFLAGHFAAPVSVDRPLVVLGHPGSGKSLFTKVCAARLSTADRFTPVRIALRDVTDPTAPLYQQMSGALEKATNGRVGWAGFCDAAEGTVRVLFIDGLDELMQATGSTQSSYLAGVTELQRVEKVTGNPLAVVVTARTIVADLAEIPDGSLVVKLEDFSDTQVERWLEIWRATNAGSGLLDLDMSRILRLGDLSHQPLLLLLLALYASRRPLPEEDSAAGLYGALLHDFITREIAKPGQAGAGSPAQRRYDALWQLGVVAFGMINRGRLHLGEDQLRLDLAALSRRNADPILTPAGMLDPAQRIIGRFFFITAAEADGGNAGRSYEFLHATFGEYLVAYQLVEQLSDLHQALGRPSSQQWDDDLLFALLSHRLVTAGAAAVLPFARQLLEVESEKTREGVLAVVSRLIRAAPERWGKGAFASYDPSGGRYLDRLATYTANLVLLLTQLVEEPVPLAYLAPAGIDPEEWWTTLLDLWHATFQREFGEEWRGLLSLLGRPAGRWAGIEARTDPVANTFVTRLRLETANRVRGAAYNAGIAAMTGTYRLSGADRDEELSGELIAALTDPSPDLGSIDHEHLVAAFRAAGETASWLARPAVAYLCRFGDNLAAGARASILKVLLASGNQQADLGPGLALLVALYPDLIRAVPAVGRLLLTPVDTDEDVMTLAPRDRNIEIALLAGEAVWQRSDRDIYGFAYLRHRSLAADLAEQWAGDIGARVPVGAGDAARRALIRQVVTESVTIPPF